jgi:hypothetical protein
MFAWFKAKPRRPTWSTQTVDAVLDIVARYGTIMEQLGMAIVDVSKLPLPKPQMKTALKVAWQVAPNDQLRNGVECGFVYLAHFQEGVGEEPVDWNLPPVFDMAKVAAIVDRYLAWSGKVQAEMDQLQAELNEFKRTATQPPTAGSARRGGWTGKQARRL